MDAQTVMERCDTLGGLSEEPGRLTRRYATEALARAQAAVAGWMESAGMAVRRDPVGNLIGRYAAAAPGARTLLLGSHLDSVRDAGRYDGPLGVLVALACVERLHRQGRRLRFAVEVIAFADEEGLRYHTAYLGSAALAGRFDPAWLDLRDTDGVPLAEALRTFGGDPGAIDGACREAGDLLGYCEVHIEQGPVLEAEGMPVGLVTAIAGQSRSTLRFAGVAGHAGTMPMHLRHDALCAAAEFVLAAEALARSLPGLVATTGQIDADPGASNVIPGIVTISLDVRHQDDTIRVRAIDDLRGEAGRIAATRAVTVEWHDVQEHSAVLCSPRLMLPLEQAIQACGVPIFRLSSGAGHDGVALSVLTEIAMLFVRCKGGVSHNPAESVMVEDVAVALDVLSTMLLSIEELNDVATLRPAGNT
jgi:allantoate deiminase